MDFINEPDAEEDDAEWARITAMSREEVEVELKAKGISTEGSPEVRARFEAARQKLRERAAKDSQ
jgi:flagellar biosynthesis protein FlhB